LALVLVMTAARRIIGLTAAIATIATFALLAPIWLHVWSKRPEPVYPVVASGDELVEIVRAVLAQSEFGDPPPPPIPPFFTSGRDPEYIKYADRPVVLLNRTIRQRDSESDDGWDFSYLLSRLYKHRLPLQWRREFIAGNRQSVTLTITPTTSIIVINADELKDISRLPGKWHENFYRRYPGTAGWVQFSNAVLSPSGDRALIHVFNGIGGIHPLVRFVVLKRQGEHWAVEHEYPWQDA